jgi:hypothetical protein
MQVKVLLLNNNYSILSFITERKAIKLLFKGKVEVVSHWDNIKVHFSGGDFTFPAVLKMKYYVHKVFSRLLFSRKAVFRRDHFTCQYCGKHLNNNQITLDHIIPKCNGGTSSFKNCVAACHTCNKKKGKQSLEEAGLTLLSVPDIPLGYIYHINEQDAWHEEWDKFFSFRKA